MSTDTLQWWGNLLHGGMLLDLPRLNQVLTPPVDPMPWFQVDRLRRELAAFGSDPSKNRSNFVAFVLEKVCTFHPPLGTWHRGSKIDASWTRRGFGNEAIRPAHLWVGPHDSYLPVFLDDNKRLGLGRGKRIHSQALQWLRATGQSLAVLTNGQQWRLIFAGLDFDAFVEWDNSQWFAEGEASPELAGFRSLLQPRLWHNPQSGAASPLLAAIRESRKGQADLSKELGERVRRATEHLIQAHFAALAGEKDIPPADIYRAAVRMIMRLVVVLFAESREGLLPRDNTIYYGTYSLHGLRELLERISPHRLADAYAAYPRIIALLRLIHGGSYHEAIPVPAYGGELFAPGRADSPDPMSRALCLFETACLNQSLMSDLDVRKTLDLLTRTRIKIRQGRTATWMTAPVDFSGLDSEYIGILYEGLLDFELRCAAADEPIVFLAVGNEPALPLSTLEQMDDSAIKNLLEKLKDTSAGDEEEEVEEESDEPAEAETDAEAEVEDVEEVPAEEEAVAAQPDADSHYTLQARAENWAKRVCQIANLVARPRGTTTPEKQMQYERALAAKARQLVVKVVLPGEWYLVRWGGTRKGSGTFYTRPPLAVPTVHRTLRPLAYDPPLGADGKPNTMAPPHEWKVKTPEAILSLKVCDPACGSGSFDLAALRFLTQALYESMQKHGRFRQHNGRDIMDLIMDSQGRESLVNEALPCRPDDDDFEPRVKAILRRYVVERCIYGVDLDPLAVELCRLSLWIETLDRSLPLTFLNHKIKVGNSLVGAWFDQFLHYPAMAWERDGGDKSHTNGVHFQKEAWTKAIKEFAKLVKTDLVHFIDGSRLFYPVDLTTVRNGHDAAEVALKEIHNLGIAQVDQRAEKYEALCANPAFQRLKEAFDLWCSLWFWPADQLGQAPLPTQFAEGKLSDTTREIAKRLARQQRFFHWELEFPDVFNSASRGFDAILGNPPWETLQPNSKEFFTAFDPLYRSYGKQEAITKQTECFARDEGIERQWLDYNVYFKCFGNWLAYAGFPFGNRVTENNDGKKSHDLNLGDRGRDSFRSSQRRHDKWKQKREESSGYADVDHCFRHQGSGKAYTYKMFVEQCHALLSQHGRLGLIVPSGLYSDDEATPLRNLLLDHCRWEWIFGFTNTQVDGSRIFDIHPSYKFNPVIAIKGGKTLAIRTAFIRRDLADWERGEQFAIDYTRQQILQFSPVSRAILEIQSQHDLAVLSKIYANAVLLDDQSERGWRVIYAQGDVNMTTDSKYFPPRAKWEEWGYRPDEYSRWIKGPWKPIGDLYSTLGVKALPETQRCCAQPPYDRLPILRAAIPAGIVLSRDATHFIHEDDIPSVGFTDSSGRPLMTKIVNEEGEKEELELSGPGIAVPLYQGVMMNQLTANRAWFASRVPNRWTVLDEFPIEMWPKYLMGKSVCNVVCPSALQPKYLARTIARQSDARTVIGTPAMGYPAGHSLSVLRTIPPSTILQVGAFLSSLPYDWAMRRRIAGTNVNRFSFAESAVPHPKKEMVQLAALALGCSAPTWSMAEYWLRLMGSGDSGAITSITRHWAMRSARRMEVIAAINAVAFVAAGLDIEDARLVLSGCDLPVEALRRGTRELPLIGFWRVDKKELPELRLTTLIIVALHDLQNRISACDGKIAEGISAFCHQNDGEGWVMPETLRLTDYGLGHDDRAKQHQPVRECFGPRFYDWQLTQTPEDSWKECHLHARNLLGPEGYQKMLDEIAGNESSPSTNAAQSINPGMGTLFDTASPT